MRLTKPLQTPNLETLEKILEHLSNVPTYITRLRRKLSNYPREELKGNLKTKAVSVWTVATVTQRAAKVPGTHPLGWQKCPFPSRFEGEIEGVLFHVQTLVHIYGFALSWPTSHQVRHWAQESYVINSYWLYLWINEQNVFIIISLLSFTHVFTQLLMEHLLWLMWNAALSEWTNTL